jgi:hypothetical protein
VPQDEKCHLTELIPESVMVLEWLAVGLEWLYLQQALEELQDLQPVWKKALTLPDEKSREG